MIVAHLAPVWAFEYFPSRDGPVHVFNASVIREYHDTGSAIFREYFTINQRPDPTWFVHLVLTALLYVVSPWIAEKIVVSFCVILLPVSVRYAILAIDREAGFLSFLSFPFIHSYFLHMGFYSFSLSLAMTFIVLGYWIRNGQGLRIAQVAMLGLMTIVLYLCHIFSLFMVYIAVGVLLRSSWADSP